MKKFLGLVATILLALSSCTQESLVNESMPLGKIQASFENSSVSRMAVSEDNALTWTVGDAFKIFNDAGDGSTWTLEGTGGSGTGVFSGTLLDGNLKGAAFPASVATSLSSNVLTMELPAELDYAEGICNLPMWASFTSLEGAISFKHLGAMLKIDFTDIPEGYNKLIVSADKPLAGVFTANNLSGAEPVLAAGEGAVKSVSVKFTASESKQNKLFYLPLPVGKYGSINVSVSDGTNTLSIADWSNRTIERKKVYLASLTYKTSEATTTAAIAADLGESKTVTLDVVNKVTDVTEPVILPENALKVGLNFAEVPTTTSEKPLKIEETSSAAGAELSISIPTSETEASYLELDVPNTTVNVESGNYKKIVAHTAANTLVLGENVTAEDLEIQGGNVILSGAQVKISISRSEANADEVTYVYVASGSELEGITIGEGIEVILCQIRYTSTDGNVVTPNEGAVFGANIVSNTYENGVGIIEFDGPVTTIDYQGSNISGFDAAFSDCLTLESIEIPNSVTSIAHQSFFGCKNLKSVSLPQNITELQPFTFHNCESLESIVIPDGVTTIGNKAFGNNLKLASVTMPKELVTIGQMAFSWCEVLPEVTIPEKVKTINSRAFTGCYLLNTIHCKPTTPPSGRSDAFPQNGGATTMYVPTNSLDAYKEAWPDFNGQILASS